MKLVGKHHQYIPNVIMKPCDGQISETLPCV